MTEDPTARYHAYLERFTAKVGPVEVGAFAKFGGKLIKKMTADEFAAAFQEYADMESHYREGIERGDTINDVVLRLLREKSAALVLAPPAL